MTIVIRNSKKADECTHLFRRHGTNGTVFNHSKQYQDRETQNVVKARHPRPIGQIRRHVNETPTSRHAGWRVDKRKLQDRFE